jgi:D-ribose pyranase
LIDDIPRVLDVLQAIRKNFVIVQAFMAEEFHAANQPETRDAFAAALKGVPTLYEPHVIFKKRVPHAIGLIRTSDTVSYANLILESG